MARSTNKLSRRSADLAPGQMKTAMARLQARVEELKAFNPKAITDGDGPEVKGLEARIKSTLSQVFGEDTYEYKRLEDAWRLDQTLYVLNLAGGPSTSVGQIQSGVGRGVASAIALLQAEIDSMREALEHIDAERLASPEGRALRAYQGLDLHPEIARAASSLYQDGHYANAVEDAVKALNVLVRLRSGLEIDGVPLMQKAFSPNGPILKFNELSDQSDRDEQLGFMNMFSGAVCGLRNPRAHVFIKDDSERALEFIAFVSLLAKLLDEAKK
jgi:uncharacterized protein (TIGR02391 family)